MSLYDSVQDDLKAILDVDDLAQSAIFNGIEIVCVVASGFLDTIGAENYDLEISVAAFDVEGIAHGSTIQVQGRDGVFLNYKVNRIKAEDSGMLLLGLTKA